MKMVFNFLTVRLKISFQRIIPSHRISLARSDQPYSRNVYNAFGKSLRTYDKV
jgi:hypothetical protein